MSLLERIQGIGELLRREDLTTAELAGTIATQLNCNTYLLNGAGEVLNCALPDGQDCTKRETKNGLPVLKVEFKQRIAFIFQTAANLPLESCFIKDEEDCFRPNTFLTIIPIRNSRSAPGHLLLTKHEKEFTSEELVLAEASALAAAIYCSSSDSDADGGESRQKASALLVLDSMSFSEIKAIYNVCQALKGNEGFLVASKIADRIGVSRSVIVNAMRKLESAGVVDSRSLGIKGTYIKIKNPLFLGLLKERVR
jgi:transcriptional pleiotropic repressor